MRLEHGISIIAAPRLHWIDRDEVSGYEKRVPQAGRVVAVYRIAVQWRPGVNR